jgi:hypothetical protein
MIGLGLRLAVAGGREAIVRLVTIAAAVALGVGLLLATLAGINGVNAQGQRYAWLNTRATDTASSTVDPTWWQLRRDYFGGQPMGRLDVAATGPHSPVPPGIPALPGPDEFYASPALAALLATTPAAELGDRYGGRQVGVIGDAALPAPNSLLIIIGHTPQEMSQTAGAQRVSEIWTTAPANCSDCAVGLRSAGMDLVLGVVAGALLFPVLIFIGAATRLSAARREQRFAAMRLIGATPRQVSTIAMVESTAAALAGTALGFGVFLALRDPLAAIPFTGQPFFPSDLSLNLVDILLVALGVPAGAAIAARLALRRVRISPLGVTRRVTPRPPRWYRVIPMLLGIAELSFILVAWNPGLGRYLQALGMGHLLALASQPRTGAGQVAVFLPGFLVIMGGLVYAGPWFTMVGARLLARRSRRPATLIAARRLADNPQAAFRAISGLVLGLFVTSVAIGVITTIEYYRAGHKDDVAITTAVTKPFWPDSPDGQKETTVPDSVSAALRAVPGVRSLTVVRFDQDASGRDGVPPGVVSCADLARVPAFGRCPDGATTAAVWQDFSGWRTSDGPSTVWPASSVSPAALDRLPIMSLVVGTDGATSTIERARTILERAYPQSEQPPTVQGDFESDATQTMAGWRQLANVVILATVPIAGCSLAVSVAGGLSERKRPFSLLRLTGVPLRMLRRVVALESAVPLLVVAVVAVGIGLLAAQLFLRAQMQYNLRPPGFGYYAIVLVGLAVSLGIIGSTLPLLRRITGPETARNE